jgi:hypothetical protein
MFDSPAGFGPIDQFLRLKSGDKVDSSYFVVSTSSWTTRSTAQLSVRVAARAHEA